jgi:hypothetical protein
MLKPIGLAMASALLVLAVAGISPAAAAVHVESCMEKEKECKTSTVGTTFETVSKDFTIKEGETVLDKCELTTTHEVKDASSESAIDPIEVVTTKAVFSSCSGSEGMLKATGVPWKWTTTQSEWEKSHVTELGGYGFTGVTCDWVIEAPNDLVKENQDTRFVSGFLRGQGSVSCAMRLLTVGHTLAMSSVSDPKLSGAKDIRVK